MSQNLREAFIGHPGVDKQTQAQRRGSVAHSHLVLPAGMEFRFTFKDGTQSKWSKVNCGAMNMPPAALSIELRRMEDGR